ncbi:hypothetical protein ABPS01_06855, partial [Streptococcus sp. ZJ151]|uniref:hypothetical protein n=1 Tax=Streptococcus jiangjianxini TaxID=3161189 RepID=UPI0032EE47D0
MEGEKSRSNFVLPLCFGKYRTTRSLAALFTMVALSAGMISGQGYADELTESDESVVSVMSETVISNNSEEGHLENRTNQDISKTIDSTLESTADADEKVWSDDKSSLADQTLAEHTAETSDASDLVSGSSVQDTKTITDKEVSQFDLWNAVGFDQEAASDPTKIALANFPISTTRSDIPLLMSPNVKAVVLEFSGTSYYSETEGILVERDNSHDLLITYDDVTDTWRGQPYVHQSQMGNSTFVVKSIQNENGSIALYVPVTKEQISVFQKGLYTVTATYSEKLYATVSDWIINTAPIIDIATETVTAKVDEVVDLLSAVTIFDKEDDFSNSDSYTTRIETLSYENLSTGEITSLEDGTTSVQLSNPGDYRVRISVKDSDGQSAQNEYILTISPPPQDPIDHEESSPIDDGMLEGESPLSPELPSTLPDKDSEAPITADDVEEPLSPQAPNDGSEESSPIDDGLIVGESPLSPELPGTLPDKDSEAPITADDVEEPLSPQDPSDGSEESSPIDDGLTEGEPSPSPELPSTLPDKDSEAPITADDVEEFAEPQAPNDGSEESSVIDDGLLDGEPSPLPELPGTLPDKDSEAPITADDVEEFAEPQAPNNGSDESSSRDDGLTDGEPPLSPDYPDTLPDKDSEAPITADDVEEPLSPQDPSDGSDESSPRDDGMLEGESPLSPELPGTLPDKDSEAPITADDVEEPLSPQDPSDGSEESS